MSEDREMAKCIPRHIHAVDPMEPLAECQDAGRTNMEGV